MQRIYGSVLPRPAGTRSMILHQPVGPVAEFRTWNFPTMNAVRKLAPALAASCSSKAPIRPTCTEGEEAHKCLEGPLLGRAGRDCQPCDTGGQRGAAEIDAGGISRLRIRRGAA